MRRPLRDVLIEFPLAGPADPAEPSPGEGEGTPPSAAQDDAERRVAEAWQAGRDDALAEAGAAHAAELATRQADAEAALAEARAGWAAGEGARIADALRTGLLSLETSIAAAVAAALTPTLASAVRARAAEEIGQAVSTLLAGAHGALIEVRGPADLVGPVRAAFADQATVSVSDTDDGEVTVRLGDTAVTTQTALWAARLQAALEAAP